MSTNFEWATAAIPDHCRICLPADEFADASQCPLSTDLVVLDAFKPKLTRAEADQLS
jgi:hypothetical protein